MFWRLIYHGSGLGWFLNHSTIAMVAFDRVKSVYLIEFA
ncbi:hypothetical protein VAA_00107 [Vibrio anguillarum 775]|nr:hypothetical protein VAA_00107 [Vibrio anguillarum 775]